VRSTPGPATGFSAPLPFQIRTRWLMLSACHSMPLANALDSPQYELIFFFIDTSALGASSLRFVTAVISPTSIAKIQTDAIGRSGLRKMILRSIVDGYTSGGEKRYPLFRV
jgi:hypothetical protein